jgi:hypothetical protein
VRAKLDENLPDSVLSITVDFADLRGCVAVWRDGELRVRRPNRDHPSSVENYARLRRSPREPVVTVSGG